MKRFYVFLISLMLITSVKADWVQLTDFPQYYAKDIIEKNGVLYAGGYNNGMYVSYNNGANWIQRNNGLNNSQAIVIEDVGYFSSGLFIATRDGVYKSTDDGLNWVKKSDGMLIGPGAIYIFAKSVFEDEGALYSGTFNAIYKSTNNGDNWFPVTPIVEHNDFCTFHKYNNMLLAGTDGNHAPIISSTNGGATWSNMYIWNTFPTAAFCIYSEPGKLYAGAVLGMWYSTNNGVNWTHREEGLGPDPYVFDLVKVGNTLFAATNAWIYKTTNDGVNWTSVTFSGQTFQDVNKLLVYNNRMYVAAYTGLWYRNIDEILTDITNPSTEIPGEFNLSQNYPNPFNPATKIEYQIPLESSVLIKVYDFMGREIQTIVNEKKSAGSYTVDFNASALSSGVYFYKLESNNFVSTKKMTVIK